jgi:hypothetical protein
MRQQQQPAPPPQQAPGSFDIRRHRGVRTPEFANRGRSAMQPELMQNMRCAQMTQRLDQLAEEHEHRKKTKAAIQDLLKDKLERLREYIPMMEADNWKFERKQLEAQNLAKYQDYGP